MRIRLPDPFDVLRWVITICICIGLVREVLK